MFKCCLNSEEEPSSRVINVPSPENKSRFHCNRIETRKYNFLTFLPKSILLQFTRAANYIYLATAVFQVIPIVSSGSPAVSIAPFAVVILISMLREAYEDYKRWDNDEKVNQTQSMVLKEGEWIKIQWQDILVGQYVKVLTNEIVPADLILVHSTEENGLAYVETANLDGERNLKTKFCTASVPQIFPEHFDTLVASVDIQNPNKNLHSFDGNIHFDSMSAESLGQENLLLRGTVLKNTHEIVGLVVYTGHETKVMMNQGGFKQKTSSVDTRINNIQMVLAIVLVLMSVMCGLLYTGVAVSGTTFYLHKASQLSVALEGAATGFSCFLLLNFLIPISMNLSLEALKTFQAVFYTLDQQMTFKIGEQMQPCKVLNPLILEELGYVSYILTDKTGTLTCNTMEFKEVWINGFSMSAEETKESESRQLDMFWKYVVLCHDVVVDVEKDEYQGSSSDEVCFLEFARSIGFRFVRRTKTHIEVELRNKKHVFQLLMILPFTHRKMMSVVYKDLETNIITVVTKGADNCVLDRKIDLYSPTKQTSINKFLSSVSKKGLRTLVYGYRLLSIEEYTDIKSQYNSLEEKKKKKILSLGECQKQEEELYELFEERLDIIGATGVQDKLQDGVPGCIKNLRRAGIKVVMITGDKLETAENIGYLSNFIDSEAYVFRIRENTRDMELMVSDIVNSNKLSKGVFSVIVQGEAISQVINSTNQQMASNLKSIIELCNSVIFCRSTPAEKASIVEFFKRTFNKTVLAIGDGGNDVNMIKQADIGVGLIGNEGNEAAYSSDFYFGQFKFLERLLLHHGRWSYNRIAYFAVYYAFKNNVMTLMLFFYQFYCGYSAGYNLSQIYQACYNSFLGLVATLYVGIFQQDVNGDLSSNISLQLPSLYNDCRSTDLFSYKRYALWTGMSVICSAWLFFPTWYSLDSELAIDSQGRVADWTSISVSMEISSLMTVTGILTVDLKVYNWFTWVCILVGTVVPGVLALIVENYVVIDGFTDCILAFSNNFNLRLWLVTLILPLTVIILKVAYTSVEIQLFPSKAQLIIKSEMLDSDSQGLSRSSSIKDFPSTTV